MGYSTLLFQTCTRLGLCFNEIVNNVSWNIFIQGSFSLRESFLPLLNFVDIATFAWQTILTKLYQSINKLGSAKTKLLSTHNFVNWDKTTICWLPLLAAAFYKHRDFDCRSRAPKPPSGCVWNAKHCWFLRNLAVKNNTSSVFMRCSINNSCNLNNK